MNNIPYITQIIKIEPFKITCQWNTGEVLVNDFAWIFSTQNLHEKTYLLKNYDVFKNVSLSELGTLEWQNLPTKIKFNDKEIISPFDLDPVVLYEKSQPLSKYRLIFEEMIA